MRLSNSIFIDKAVELAIASGNSIGQVTTGWSKVKEVVHMTSGLTKPLREQIEKQVPELRYWFFEKSPHNEAEEGFTCDSHAVGLVFPK